MKQKLKNEWYEFKLLLKSVPSVTLTLFVMSVFAMNLLANKSINLPFDWLALDCGIIVSWFAFLTMDTVTNRFGPKGATEISILAILINLIFCLIFFAAGKISGMWGESYVSGSEDVINNALDNTFGGTWYVLAGSTLAFVVSAAVNNFLNFAIGRLFKKNPDGAVSYILRSYVSTAVGQFSDNMIFAFTVSHFFFGWTLIQCVMCAFTGMIVELACEITFSFFGYKVVDKWRKNDVGNEYLKYRKSMKGSCTQ